MLKTIIFILVFALNNGSSVVTLEFNTEQGCNDFALVLMLHDKFSDGDFLCIKKEALKLKQNNTSEK